MCYMISRRFFAKKKSDNLEILRFIVFNECSADDQFGHHNFDEFVIVSGPLL
jgi:hypothetical protein